MAGGWTTYDGSTRLRDFDLSVTAESKRVPNGVKAGAGPFQRSSSTSLNSGMSVRNVARVPE